MDKIDILFLGLFIGMIVAFLLAILVGNDNKNEINYLKQENKKLTSIIVELNKE